MSSEFPKPSSDPTRLTKQYHGVVVPMVTPSTPDGCGDDGAIIRIIETFIESKVDPFLFGTTGEAASISLEEKLRLASICFKRFVDRTTLYVGISGNSFSDSINMAKSFADLGARVAVANLPSYYSLGSSDMLRYFEKLADSIPLPLIIYNIPSTTHMSIPLDVVSELSRHTNIVGLKDSERGEDRLREAISMFKDREDFSHFIGWAAQSTNALLWGSDGLVPSSGNIVPRMYRDLYDAVIRGDMELAHSLQSQTNDVSRIYQENRSLGESLAALKIILNELDLCGKTMFPPLTAMDGSEEEDLRKRASSIKA